MIHGPCGNLNPTAPCMKEGKCTKGFPKPFLANTVVDSNSTYATYRRRCPADGGCTITLVRRIVTFTADNSFVVPYNPELSLRYNFHIDVEVVAERQFWVVGHHKTIVSSEGYNSTYKCDSASSICGTVTAVGCIGTVGVHHSIGQERLGETFCVLALFHAGSSWIEITTGTMDHVGGNNILKLLSLFHLLIGQTWLIGI